MQSIRLCLGEQGKLSEESKAALDRVRETFLDMSRVPVQFGDLKIEGLLCSFNFGKQEIGLRNLIYLECEFTSLEEGA